MAKEQSGKLKQNTPSSATQLTRCGRGTMDLDRALRGSGGVQDGLEELRAGDEL